FTNEGGVGGKIRILKNIMGLWLIQQAKKSWESGTGNHVSYDGIVAEAKKVGLPGSLIYPDDARFLNPPNMLDAIRASCTETGQEPPSTMGEFASTIFASLACRYKEVTSDLEHVIGGRVDGLHVVGGGSRNDLLCQYTADATGLPVQAGPDEATAIGNIIMQAISCGLVKDVLQGRDMVRSSFPLKNYEPRASGKDWDVLYNDVYIPLVEKIRKKD
nr:FGGY-family carbohydrate kinase [Candidatus Sigynarchaeota archaeon]